MAGWAGRIPPAGTGVNESGSYPLGREGLILNNVHHPYMFTGRERDTESGLDYFIARYYPSNLARFMSPDPLLGSAGNPQSLNRYAYTLNNPLRFLDPTGLEPVEGPTAPSNTDAGCRIRTESHGCQAATQAMAQTQQGAAAKKGEQPPSVNPADPLYVEKTRERRDDIVAVKDHDSGTQVVNFFSIKLEREISYQLVDPETGKSIAEKAPTIYLAERWLIAPEVGVGMSGAHDAGPNYGVTHLI